MRHELKMNETFNERYNMTDSARLSAYISPAYSYQSICSLDPLCLFSNKY